MALDRQLGTRHCGEEWRRGRLGESWSPPYAQAGKAGSGAPCMTQRLACRVPANRARNVRIGVVPRGRSARGGRPAPDCSRHRIPHTLRRCCCLQACALSIRQARWPRQAVAAAGSLPQLSTAPHACSEARGDAAPAAQGRARQARLQTPTLPGQAAQARTMRSVGGASRYCTQTHRLHTRMWRTPHTPLVSSSLAG